MYCAYCNLDHDEDTKSSSEHVIPFAIGGTNALTISVCERSCRKGASRDHGSPIEVFRKKFWITQGALPSCLIWKHLINSNFQLGADASAAAGPVGRHASADADWKLNTEVLTYSRAKGVFTGLTLTGAPIRRDEDSTEAIYGPQGLDAPHSGGRNRSAKFG